MARRSALNHGLATRGPTLTELGDSGFSRRAMEVKGNALALGIGGIQHQHTGKCVSLLRLQSFRNDTINARRRPIAGLRDICLCYITSALVVTSLALPVIICRKYIIHLLMIIS